MERYTIVVNKEDKKTILAHSVQDIIYDLIEEETNIIKLNIKSKGKTLYQYYSPEGISLYTFMTNIIDEKIVSGYDDSFLEDEFEEEVNIGVFDYCDYSFLNDFERNGLVTVEDARHYPDSYYLVTFSDGYTKVIRKYNLDDTITYLFVNILAAEKEPLNNVLQSLNLTSEKKLINGLTIKTVDGNTICSITGHEFKTMKMEYEKLLGKDFTGEFYTLTEVVLEYDNGYEETIKEDNIMNAIFYGLINKDKKLLRVKDAHSHAVIAFLDESRSSSFVQFYDASNMKLEPYFKANLTEEIQSLSDHFKNQMMINDVMYVIDIGPISFMGVLVNRMQYNDFLDDVDILSDEI